MDELKGGDPPAVKGGDAPAKLSWIDTCREEVPIKDVGDAPEIDNLFESCLERGFVGLKDDDFICSCVERRALRASESMRL